jgi:WD40 repeat protein
VLAFSPDLKLLASGGGDKSVKVWEVSGKQEPVGAFSEPSALADLVFSPDGRLLACGYGYPDPYVVLWSVDKRTVEGRLKSSSQYSSYVMSIAFSPDGRLLAIAFSNNSARVELWNVADRQRIHVFENEPNQYVSSVAFSPDSRLLAAGTRDPLVRIWDIGARHEVRRMSGHSEGVFLIGFSRDGKMLCSIGGDVRLWDASSGNQVTSYTLDKGSTSFGPDVSDFIRTGHSKSLAQWDLNTNAEAQSMGSSGRCVVAWSSNGKYLATGSADGTVRIKDMSR